MIRKITHAPVALAIIYRRLSLAKDLFFCAVLGDRRVLPVEIDLRKTVGHLKKEIKKRNPDLIRCDVALLKLYLAKRGNGTWLNTNDDDANALPRQELPSGTQDQVQEQEVRRQGGSITLRTSEPRFQDNKMTFASWCNCRKKQLLKAVRRSVMILLTDLKHCWVSFWVDDQRIRSLTLEKPSNAFLFVNQTVSNWEKRHGQCCYPFIVHESQSLVKRRKVDETLAWTEDDSEGLADTMARYRSIQDELGDDVSVPREIGWQVALRACVLLRLGDVGFFFLLFNLVPSCVTSTLTKLKWTNLIGIHCEHYLASII